MEKQDDAQFHLGMRKYELRSSTIRKLLFKTIEFLRVHNSIVKAKESTNKRKNRKKQNYS